MRLEGTVDQRRGVRRVRRHRRASGRAGACLAARRPFMKDPHEVVKAGDVVKVRVVEVDVARKRIALTMRSGEIRASAPARRQRTARSESAAEAPEPTVRPWRPRRETRGGDEGAAPLAVRRSGVRAAERGSTRKPGGLEAAAPKSAHRLPRTPRAPMLGLPARRVRECEGHGVRSRSTYPHDPGLSEAGHPVSRHHDAARRRARVPPRHRRTGAAVGRLQDRQDRRHRGARLHSRRRGGASALRRLRADPQEGQAAAYDGVDRLHASNTASTRWKCTPTRSIPASA